MTVYLRGSVWYTDVTRNGKRLRVSTGTSDKAQAELIAAQLRAGQSVTVRGAPAGTCSLSAAVHRAWTESWNGQKDRQMKTLHTREMLAFFGPDTPLSDIDQHRAASWVAELRAKGNSAATINRKLAVLTCLLRMAERDWALPGYRAPLIKRLDERTGRNNRSYLTEDQVVALLQRETDGRMRNLLVGLLDTGARVGELLALQWDDVREDGRLLVFRDRKAGDTLPVPTTERLRELLLESRDDFDARPFPMSYEWYLQRFRESCARAGIELPSGTALHVIRHTVATSLLERGASLSTVQGLLGHTSERTTAIYAKITGRVLRTAVGMLDSAPLGSPINATGGDGPEDGRV